MEKINAVGIPVKMIETLYARAKESKRVNHFIYDAKAIEIVEQLDYDFSTMDKNIVLGKGAMARSILLDEMVSDYIKNNPNATIINIACGMDTRFYRVDNGTIRWYNLDLPITIDARKRLLGEEDRVYNIAKSALDETWTKEVEADGPVLIISESLSMYLTKADIQKMLKIIRMRFTQADIFMEVMAPYVVKHAVEGSGENSRPKYTWGVKNGRELQKMTTGFKAVKNVSLMAGLKKMYPAYHVLQFMPTMRKMSNKIVVLQRVV